MRPNKVKAKLQKNEMSLGANLNYYSPMMVEFSAALGFEWVFIDCEHGSMTEPEVENMVRGAEAFGIVPIMRVPTNSPHIILRYLDLGVMGIVIPHICTREQAEAAVKAAKYWPMGERGSNYGTGRNNQYGLTMKDVRDYYAESNRETMVIALIEDDAGVKNIEEIVAVPDLDATWLGPADLAQSMSMPGQKAIDEALDRVVEATVKAGKISAVTHLPPGNMERLRHFYNKGSRLLGVSLTYFIRDGATAWLQGVRKLK
jgi:4-hydroxy-2-oxoheptanedioate aldolase